MMSIRRTVLVSQTILITKTMSLSQTMSITGTMSTSQTMSNGKTMLISPAASLRWEMPISQAVSGKMMAHPMMAKMAPTPMHTMMMMLMS